MFSMRATQKFMRTVTIRGMTNQSRCGPLLTCNKAQLSTIATAFTIPSLKNGAVLKQQQLLHSSSRFMSSSATTTEAGGVDVSLDQLRTSIAGGDYVRLLAKDNPYVDVVQYTHKNVIYSVTHIDYHSEALAIGITENGLVPGDVVLTFLPPHLCETVRSIAIKIDIDNNFQKKNRN